MNFPKSKYNNKLALYNHILCIYLVKHTRRLLDLESGHLLEEGQIFSNNYMKNSADQGGCYPQRPKAEVDNTLRNLQNSSYPTKAECNNCFIIHLKYLLVLKGVSPFCSLFFPSPNITQPCPQVFAVNGSIICSGLHF